MKDYILKLKNQAYSWENASPIGAGSLGAMVYGAVAAERMLCNEETIWDGGVMDTNIPDYREKLDRIRGYFLDGKPYEGEQWAKEHFSTNFFTIRSYEYAGEVTVELHRDDSCEDYRRFLDLKRGILTVSYKKDGRTYVRESFASHPARLICSRMDCDPAEPVRIRFLRPNIRERAVELCGKSARMDILCATDHTGNLFKIAVKAVSDGSFAREEDGLGLAGASFVELYISVVTAFRDPGMDTEPYLAGAEAGYGELKRRHTEDFQSLMDRSDISVGPSEDALEELSAGERLRRLAEDKAAADPGLIGLYFQFGKYLLVSSSREDTYPANLQGLWSEGLKAPWNSDYHTNINLQMNYWPAESANLPETAYALFRYMNEVLLPGGRRVARENYKAGGMVVHHVADIYQFAAAADGLWGLWPLGGAWLAYHMWEHYLYTGDEEFLRDTAYEFIRDCAVFFLDTMFEGKNGELLSGPSTSPENSYLVEVNGRKEPVSMALSPTMDIQIIGGLLDFYIRCEELLGIDSAGKERARRARGKMPKLKIGKFGQLQEWMEDYEENEPGHRHISHAFGLYPAAQITRQTPEYFEAMKVTVERRIAFGGGRTGWSRAWLIGQLARLKDGEGAAQNLRALFTDSTLPNLLDNHPPFQIDGNFGGCAVIAEMVMQSHEGFISLLPAIGREMKDGRFENLRARGDYTVSAEWRDGKLLSCTVAGKGDVMLELPEAQAGAVLCGRDGSKYCAAERMVRIPCGVTVFTS